MKIKSVEAIGSYVNVKWKLTDKGLELETPSEDEFEYVRVYKINTVE